MAEPIVEQVAAAVKTKAETITAANGYTAPIASVVRPTRRGDPPDRYIVHQYVVQTQGEERRPDEGQTTETDEWIIPIHLSYVLMPGDDDTTALDTYKNRFAADIRKAFPEVSGASWYATGTRRHWVRGPYPLAEEFAPAEGVTMTIEVMYATAYSDPYTAG